MRFTKWQAVVIIAAAVVMALLTDWGHYEVIPPVEFTGDMAIEEAEDADESEPMAEATDETGAEDMEDLPGQYRNDVWGIRFEYPEDWYIQERRGGDTTPFAVVISDTNLDIFSAAPGKAYPDRYINIYLYKTEQSAQEYARSYSEGANSFYAFRDRGEYVVGIESVVANEEDVADVERAFNQIAQTLDVWRTELKPEPGVE